MVKRIGIIILVSAILITGLISFRNLNYWERSVMIFKYDASAQISRDRGGRGERSSEGLRHGGVREGSQRSGGISGRNLRENNVNRGRDSHKGNTINLDKVLSYLAVLALFTLIIIYLEKAYWLLFKKKNYTQENRDLII